VPFHVIITPRHKRRDGRLDVFALDKDETWIEAKIAQPWQQGLDIFVEGRVFASADIATIHITKTDKTADLVRLEYELKAPLSGSVRIQPSVFVRKGTDVTERFLHGPPGTKPLADEARATTYATNRKAVMVIYGHDSEANTAIFDWLRAIGLQPREFTHIIHATGSASPNVWDAIRNAFNDVQAVIAFFTPDEYVLDRTTSPADSPAWRLQARPNVLLEAGIALVTHPDRTVLATLGPQELPSDLAGRHYVKLSHTSPQPLHDLATRLHNAGCDTDQTGTDWLNPARFPDRDDLTRIWHQVIHTSSPLATTKPGGHDLPPDYAGTLPDDMARLAETVSPTAAVAASTQLVEHALRERLHGATTEDLRALNLAQLASRALELKVIDDQLADSLSGFSVMRLLAATEQERLDHAKAAEFTNLATALLYLLKRR